ncbi:hypothetical protein GM418_12950 [Maribellus comscasis]|uniref:START domain-containing protein n=1 Tax=Maribellus comscasis TaxID=2681766 RepID=A0A6I6JNM9_9BACT|nr:hypothetical protein [Maribellus comscasis]QGY44535.1 hypothetical protein GM418_12950 [Maribellus comscasis]
MIKQKTGLFIFFLCIVVPVHIKAKESKTKEAGQWALARETKGVSIYYRWIVNDTVKTREMRAKFKIKADVAEILPQFSEVENYYCWAVGIKKCEIKKLNENSWVTYTLMDYPWPFKQKDLVTRYLVRIFSDETTISVYSDPNFFAKKDGVERVQNYFGEWKFRTNKSGTTEVDYRVVSYVKPVFPRFIQDPVIQKLFIDSFHELKLLAETK